MSRAENIQLNVRSAFARHRVNALTKLTGMTASEVVEDALRGYVPPGVPANTGKLVRRGAARCWCGRRPASRSAWSRRTKRSNGAASTILAIDALVDSNVIIAALAGDHEHHAASADLFGEGNARMLGVAAHSYAEAYSTLTRRGIHAPFRFAAEEAWAALEGGIGARLYDRLIGETAIAHAIPVIVTWNIGHMRGLFPTLAVQSPREFSQTH